MPPLLADFIYSSDCKLICEKSLTLPIFDVEKLEIVIKNTEKQIFNF